MLRRPLRRAAPPHQTIQKSCAAGRQVANEDLEPGSRDQRIFRAVRLDPPDWAIAPVRRKDRHDRIARAHGTRCRVRYEYGIGQLFGRDRGQYSGSQRFRVGGMIGVEPGPLQARHVSQPWHRPRIVVTLDEIGKVAAVFEQKRRSGRRFADMEARHRPKEVRAGDAQRRWKAGGQRFDQADRDDVAVDGVSLDRCLAVRSRDSVRRGTVRIEQTGAECRGIVEPVAKIARLELILRHGLFRTHGGCRRDGRESLGRRRPPP